MHRSNFTVQNVYVIVEILLKPSILRVCACSPGIRREFLLLYFAKGKQKRGY